MNSTITFHYQFQHLLVAASTYYRTGAHIAPIVGILKLHLYPHHCWSYCPLEGSQKYWVWLLGMKLGVHVGHL